MSPSSVGARSESQWEPFMGALRARIQRERRRRRQRRAAVWALALAGALTLAAALSQGPPEGGHLLMARVPLRGEGGLSASGAGVTRLPSGAYLVQAGGGVP